MGQEDLYHEANTLEFENRLVMEEGLSVEEANEVIRQKADEEYYQRLADERVTVEL